MSRLQQQAHTHTKGQHQELKLQYITLKNNETKKLQKIVEHDTSRGAYK